MKRIAIMIFLVSTCGLLILNFSACSRENEKKYEWTARLKNGEVITEEDLNRSRKSRMAFQRLLNYPVRKAKPAKLRSIEANKENLEGAKLSGFYLEAIHLEGANLEKADLSRANLKKAILTAADLKGANLMAANLSKANLQGAELQDASLSFADLREADLRDSDLRCADLSADLSGADLSGSDLSDVDLIAADLKEANLHYAILKKANLVGADLRQAKLISADLSDADLRKADLRGLELDGAIIKNADLRDAIGLKGIRESFKKAGSGDNARLVTYYIKLMQWERQGLGGVLDKIESLFNLVFFDLTCQYGLQPGRALIIWGGLIFYFAFFYPFALTARSRKTGIWLILSKERVSDATTKARPFRLTGNFPPGFLPPDLTGKIRLNLIRGCRMARIGIYFSLLSAFNIGWRNLNPSNWITSLQQRDYALRATGWARSLSGIQRLLSAYLLVLYLLTTLGQPF